MKHFQIIWFGLGMLLISGCCTTLKKEPQLDKVLNQAFSPIYDVSLIQTGAIDLLYCAGAFLHKNNRWPQSYAELSEFLKHSDGWLAIQDYERVEMNPMPDNGLEVVYVREGGGKEMKIKLGSSAKAKKP